MVVIVFRSRMRHDVPAAQLASAEVSGPESGLEARAVYEELLAASDFVALCVPLTAETNKLIGEKELRANLLPGVTIVPAMVIAIEKAQEAGIRYNRQ